MPGRAGPPRLLPGLPARRAGGSVRSPAGGQSHKEEEEAGRDQGSALPARGRKPLERGAAQNSQPSTRHYRRSGDIKREDGAKDYRMHERPRHQRTSARAIVQGSCSRAPKKPSPFQFKVRLLSKAQINKPRSIVSRGVKKPVFLPFSVPVAG
uniref:Uncharacterized protein n=1 Tax=Pipistrellus kuhlii TaxID=59472 RepID=A0A7J7X084_PIPKU|nr:hypothetical protein mPipKuh1_010733 [Pipistrellus kuhlii]